jgi:hypothetical protein
LGSASPNTAFLAKASGEAGDLFQRVALLSRLEEALGSDHRQATETRVAKIVGDLRATFASLPKNGRGAVASPAARYAIHRYFIQRHGWEVKGLAPAGQAWSSSSPVSALGDRMPEDVHGIFEEHLSVHGFDLHELAVLAATLENLIHAEGGGRLSSTYDKLEKDWQSSLSAEEAMDVVETYLQSMMLSYNISEMSKHQVSHMRQHIDKLFPYWQDAKVWLGGVQRDVAPDRKTMDFSDVSQIVEAVSERYGKQADKDCEDIQQKLVTLEDAGTGRVKLRDFYESVAARGFWNFRESVEYLKHAGAIDESDPSAMRVIIPNYLQMSSNCLVPSEYYAICCIDRCESMMAHLEREIQAPHATAERILGLVSALASDSVAANRTLPAALVRKLEDVAAHHGGVVPLHGRLFAQWMHYAYPRECVYPHVSNTTGGMSAAEWKQATGMPSSLKKEEVAAFAETLPKAADAQPRDSEDGEGCMAMWVPEEELVDAVNWQADKVAQQEQAFSVRQVLGVLALLALVGSSAVALRDFVSQASAAVQGDGFFVAKPGQQKVLTV